MAQRCHQCLYGPHKIVSNERRREILRGLRRSDSHFICHLSTMAGEVDVACRADWDQRTCGQMGRIAGRLNVVRFTDEHGNDVPPT